MKSRFRIVERDADAQIAQVLEDAHGLGDVNQCHALVISRTRLSEGVHFRQEFLDGRYESGSRN